MSPQKALEKSLLQQIEHMRESPSTEKAASKQNKMKRSNLDQGKSISNLERPKSDQIVMIVKMILKILPVPAVMVLQLMRI